MNGVVNFSVKFCLRLAKFPKTLTQTTGQLRQATRPEKQDDNQDDPNPFGAGRKKPKRDNHLLSLGRPGLQRKVKAPLS